MILYGHCTAKFLKKKVFEVEEALDGLEGLDKATKKLTRRDFYRNYHAQNGWFQPERITWEKCFPQLIFQ